MDFSGWNPELEQDSLAALESGAMSLQEAIPPAGDVEFVPPEELNPAVSLRIEYQRMNDCTAHGGTTAFENAFLFATGRMIQFSPRWLYAKTQELDGIRSDSGSSVANSVKVMRTLGLATEEACPYDPNYSSAKRLPQTAAESAAKFILPNYVMIRSYEEALLFLRQCKGAITWGTLWGYNPNADGVVNSWNPGAGGHCTALAGYSRRKDGNNPFLYLDNSWSQRWGNKGRAEVSPSAIESAFRSKYTVAIGVFGMTSPPVVAPDYSKAIVA